MPDNLLTHLLLFIISVSILIISGSLLVRYLSKIASFLRLSEFVAAFILMAMATTLPELFVGISSALNDNTALALGTVLGSNIVNLTLIIGIPIILIKGMKIKKEVIAKDAPYTLIIMTIPLILMWIGHSISRIDGLLLLGVFLLNSYRTLKTRKRFRKKFNNNPVKRKEIVFTVILFVLSIIVLFKSSDFVVKYATLLSIDLLLPPIMIGLFLVAIGTSLPELVFGTKAATKGHPDMSLGNVLGANIANSTLVLGITALINPITGQFLLFFISAIFMMMAGFLFITFIESGKKLDWREGVSLILLYIFFVAIEFYIKSVVSV